MAWDSGTVGTARGLDVYDKREIMSRLDVAVVRARLDALAKPQGSLGSLERLAERLAVTQGTLSPQSRPRRLVIFAGDHGVVAEGVGIWPSAVTTAMIDLIGQGRAASSALASASGTELRLIDVGSCVPGSTGGTVVNDRRVAAGSANLAKGPALTAAEFEQAFSIGTEAAAQAAADGCRVMAVGELGIGNTTPATCLIALLTGADSQRLTGPGAGATDLTLATKRRVVAAAVERAQPLLAKDPRAAIAAVCGFEIAAMAGAIVGAEKHGLTVVLDGVVTAAAALIARTLQPTALDTAIVAHVGAEPAHRVALDALGLEGFLDWGLRLGEGTGALLVMPMLDAAAALLTDVATLAEVTGGAA
jgi:nicotinate-nucleotide--dimethylbenzimidazole phosphoribosyltransferase